jgi:O-antigen ligase
MLTLQSSPGIDAVKLGYLVAAFIAFAAAAWSIWRSATLDLSVARTWLLMSLAFWAVLAMSFAVSRAEGTPIGDWARDAVTYALFASVPIFALDAAWSAPRRAIITLLVIVGVLGALSWATHWIQLRHIADLPLSRLLFPSPQVPVALYLFAMAAAIQKGRGGGRWALLAGLVLGCFLVTGTRSSLLFLAGPLAMMAVAGRERLRSSVTWLAAHGSVAVAIVLAFQAALWLPSVAVPPLSTSTPSPVPGGGTTAPPNIIGERIGTIGSLASNPLGDPSLRERIAQYQAAFDLVRRSPLVGMGPGHQIEWTDVSNIRRSAFTADTPLVYLVKFGLVGLIPLGLFLWAYVDLLRRLLGGVGRTASALVLVGYGGLALIGLPLGFPMEDKGTSFALMLILALCFGDLRAASERHRVHRDSLKPGSAVAPRDPAALVAPVSRG